MESGAVWSYKTNPPTPRHTADLQSKSSSIQLNNT